MLSGRRSIAGAGIHALCAAWVSRIRPPGLVHDFLHPGGDRRQLLHHDGLRRPSQGRGAGEHHDRYAGTGAIRSDAADADPECRRAEQAERDHDGAERPAGHDRARSRRRSTPACRCSASTRRSSLTSSSPTLPRTTSKAAGWRRGVSPRRSAGPARSSSSMSSRASRRPISARRASATRSRNEFPDIEYLGQEYCDDDAEHRGPDDVCSTSVRSGPVRDLRHESLRGAGRRGRAAAAGPAGQSEDGRLRCRTDAGAGSPQ